jgi:hypothetical protein
MKTENMPGFTAEASFYEARESYRTMGISSPVTAQVMPQLQATGLSASRARADPCRGACRYCAVYGYVGCCNGCDACLGGD